ncbi:MAG: FmdE family protein [Chloroflexota bacterium]|nr:FmdE family protein [Chloroflexota bacterium]
MVDRDAMFARIDSEDVDLIWEPTSVEYDNFLGVPISFQYRAKRYEVLEVVGVFRHSLGDPSMTYLVRTREGVFALYLVLSRETSLGRRTPARWILYFRVDEKEEAKMLVDMKLKRVADFHGHLCPGLVIGYRACQFALESLRLERLWQPGLRVIVENETSALDAVQILTGCTKGNGRLRVYDHGKHAYTFFDDAGNGLRLELKFDALAEAEAFLELEHKISAGTASLLETARYWAMLNGYVRTLLDLPNEVLFDSQRVALQPENAHEESSALSRCSKCGDLVIYSCLLAIGEEQLCPRCAQAISRGN